MKQFVPDTRKLYRLPFSKNDNPNGWIEITTKCNLKCPGCYRGCNREDNQGEHSTLEEIKDTIDQMRQLRNCQIISISGGEPLMHPELGQIIQYIRQSGMIPFVHTNGRLLTKDLLNDMKSNGIGGLIIRIDSLSGDRKSNDRITSYNVCYTKVLRKPFGLKAATRLKTHFVRYNKIPARKGNS